MQMVLMYAIYMHTHIYAYSVFMCNVFVQFLLHLPPILSSAFLLLPSHPAALLSPTIAIIHVTDDSQTLLENVDLYASVLIIIIFT